MYSRLYTILSAVLLTVLAASEAGAQYIRSFNAHQFLGASAVYHIGRDHAGFLWFCTDHGLVKYDGNTIRSFSRRDGLPDNTVFNMYEDRDGRIWPFCFNGKYCFIAGDSVHTEGNDRMLAALPHTGSYITCMAEDPVAGLYIGFISRHILRINKGKAIWDTLGRARCKGVNLEENKLSYLPVVAAGIIVNTGGHIKLISDSTGVSIHRNGKMVWQLQHAALTDKTVADLCLTADGQLAVSTSYGLVLADTATKKMSYHLNGMRVTGCATDIAGNLWVSTANNGVYQLHRELNRIRPLPAADSCEWTTLNDGRTVFIRHDTLYEFTARGTTVTAVPAAAGIAGYYDPSMVTDKLVASYDNWGRYARVAFRNGKTVFKERKLFKRLYSFHDSLFLSVSKTEVCLFRLQDGHFGAITSYFEYPQRITASCQDPVSRNVYFICGIYLYMYDFRTGVTNRLRTAAQLSGGRAMMISGDQLYIANEGYGYMTMDLRRKSDSLPVHAPHVIVNGFIPLANGQKLLLSDATDYLVPAGSPETLRCLRYPFSAAAYERIAICGSNCLVRIDGRCYYFDTALLNRYVAQPRAYLQRLVVNGKNYSPENIAIRHAEKADIQMGIGLLDFGNNAFNIDYRILGPDGIGGWTRTHASEIAVLLHKAGSYQIQIKPAYAAADSAPLTIHLVLFLPFYRSATFMALCSIALLLAAIAVLVLVLRYRRRQFTRELNYLKLEHRAINALLNPHFVFNAINNIQSLIHRSEKQDATDYLATLSHLIRQNLENLKCNLIPLEDELKLIKRYIQLQDLRFGNISLQVDTGADDLLQVQVLPLLVHTFVENAIVHGYRKQHRPFVIHISVRQPEKKYLEIVVEDNGIGLRAALDSAALHNGSSMGISFSRRRLDRLSEFYGLEQSVAVEDLSDTGGQGTRVTIILYAHLKALLEQKHMTV